MNRWLAVSGSPARTSRSAVLLQYAVDAATAAGVEIETLALRDLPAAELLQQASPGPALRDAIAAVTAADAVLFATPVYQAAYSGLLKSFVDLLPRDGLAGTPVLPLATAGSASHLLALDYSLKPLLAALGARHILGGVFVADADWQELGKARVLPSALLERLAKAVTELAAVSVPTQRIARPRSAAVQA